MAVVITGVKIVAAVYAYKKDIFDAYNLAVDDDIVEFDGRTPPGAWLVASETEAGKAIAVNPGGGMPLGIPVFDSSKGKRNGEVTVTDVKNIDYRLVLDALLSSINPDNIEDMPDYGGTGVNPYWQWLKTNSGESYAVPIQDTVERPIFLMVWQKMEFSVDGEEYAYEFNTAKEVMLNGCSDIPINSVVTLLATDMNANLCDADATALEEVTDPIGDVFWAYPVKMRSWDYNPGTLYDLLGTSPRGMYFGVGCYSGGGESAVIGASEAFDTSPENRANTNGETGTISFDFSALGNHVKYYIHTSGTITGYGWDANGGSYALPTMVSGLPVTEYAPCVIFKEITSVSTTLAETITTSIVRVGNKIPFVGTGTMIFMALPTGASIYNKLADNSFHTKYVPIRAYFPGAVATVAADTLFVTLAPGVECKVLINGRWHTREYVGHAPLTLSTPNTARTFAAGTDTIVTNLLNIDLSRWSPEDIFGADSGVTADMQVMLPVSVSLKYTSGGKEYNVGSIVKLYISMGDVTTVEYVSHTEVPGQAGQVSNLRFKVYTRIASPTDMSLNDLEADIINKRKTLLDSYGRAYAKESSYIDVINGSVYVIERFIRTETTSIAAGANIIPILIPDFLPQASNTVTRNIAFNASGGGSLNSYVMTPMNIDNSFASIISATYTDTSGTTPL